MVRLLAKPIFSGFASNTLPQDTMAALRLLFMPWLWQHGAAVDAVTEQIQQHLDIPFVHMVDSGRTALLLALQSVGVKEGDEVIVQAYTCMVVVNAIRWAGATPVYVDIGEDACIDITQVSAAITDKTSCIVAQHTFGNVSDIGALRNIADAHNLALVEDCAHVFKGRAQNGSMLGTVGDAAIFSFGSDKALSSVRGGAVVTSDATVSKKIEDRIQRLPVMGRLLTIQHILYVIIFPLAKPWYHLGIGKAFLYLVYRMHVLARIVTKEEKCGKQPIYYPTRFPNALAVLLDNQLQGIDDQNQHRIDIANVYTAQLGQGKSLMQKNIIPMQWVMRVGDPVALATALKREGIHLSLDWNGAVIVPKGSDMSVTGYEAGSAPVAERLSAEVLQLPTHRGVSRKDASRIASIIRPYV